MSTCFQKKHVAVNAFFQSGMCACLSGIPRQTSLRRTTVRVLAGLLLPIVVLGCSKTSDNLAEISARQSVAQSKQPGGTSGQSQDAGQMGEVKSSETGSASKARPWSPSQGFGDFPGSLHREHGQKTPTGSAGEVSQGPVAERISGYMTGGEYLIVPSKFFPQGMAVVTLPSDYEANREKNYPLVVVFGGAGECARPPRSGALAWMHYYKTDEAVHVLRSNHLTAKDFRGLAKASEIETFNEKLKRRPYDGVILACPYSPLLAMTTRLEAPEYESFIIEELIPALKSRYRVAKGSIGVDGVSMGGARSMYYGFKYPETFASIGSVQGAFGPYLEIYGQLVTKNRDILKKRSIQLVTSDKDPMAPSVEKMHNLLESHGIPHNYLILTGPHDYVFNQGPGSLSLLIFHDQALAKKAGLLIKPQ